MVQGNSVVKLSMAPGALRGHENRERIQVVKDHAGLVVFQSHGKSAREAVNRRTVRRSAERPSAEDDSTRCECSTAATGIRRCDWRWVFVFSGSALRRVV